MPEGVVPGSQEWSRSREVTCAKRSGHRFSGVVHVRSSGEKHLDGTISATPTMGRTTREEPGLRTVRVALGHTDTSDAWGQDPTALPHNAVPRCDEMRRDATRCDERQTRLITWAGTTWDKK